MINNMNDSIIDSSSILKIDGDLIIQLMLVDPTDHNNCETNYFGDVG